ncbi:hypothetical protein [Geminicoccus flavidas]|uniref:hypothetical protein n=1 Tax=Geminicoccus flavidas TaxID=2506407 RepID=UPI00135C9FA5|nr:hypothetical protein [Geminicoccus flavidas]
MLRGWFVDRHFYTRDRSARGRYTTFTRAAQIRLASAGLGLVLLTLLLAGVVVWDRLGPPGTTATASSGLTPALAAEHGGDDEILALRAALAESREKRAELAAVVESLERRLSALTEAAPDQAAELDRLRQDHDEAVQRALAAEIERDAAIAERELAEARVLEHGRDLASREPIDPASVPDRIRALELELELVRANDAADSLPPDDRSFYEPEAPDADGPDDPPVAPQLPEPLPDLESGEPAAGP